MQRDDSAMARALYDAAIGRYVEGIGTEVSAATEAAIDRALLAAFVEVVRAHPARRVADIGCGPGRIASLLDETGATVVGVDVSWAMVSAARNAHAGISLVQGRLSQLPIADRSLAGVVAWYSIIHTGPDGLVGVAAELARVLARGAQLLVAFQAGAGEPVHRDSAYGTDLPLRSYRHDPDEVARLLAGAGLRVSAVAVRQPELAHESTPQAFIWAHADN